MKYFLLVIIISFLTACDSSVQKASEAQNETETPLLETKLIEDFNRSYTGTIDDKYEIVMSIELIGENISGSYYYTVHNKSISLKGSFSHVNNSFIIDEFSKGEKTGSFSGEINSEISISGLWTAFSKAPGRVKPIPFELTKLDTEFVWYSKERPFHPYHVSQLLGLGDREPEVDISNPIELPEGFSMYEDEGEFPSGFTIDYGDDFVMRTPYFQYNYLGKEGNKYFIGTSDCGGGTGIFSSITILELKGSLLSEVASVCAGDRCNGGVGNTSYKDGKIYFSQNITSDDLYIMAINPSEKPQVSLDYCAMCCVGEANYEYDVNSKETTFISFQSFLDSENEEPEDGTDLEYFYYLLDKHLSENGDQLNQDQLDNFVTEFIQFLTQ